MNRSWVIEWIYDLPLQTLTDELKEDIIELIINYTQDKVDIDERLDNGK